MMTETEYIIATNRVKISLMMHILRDVLPGDDYGVSDKEAGDLGSILGEAESRLFEMITLSEEQVNNDI